MSDNNKIIYLVFEGDKKEVKLPNDFTNLKNYFLSVFNLHNEDDDKYSFFYKDQNNNEVEIIDKNSFKAFLLLYTQNKIKEIYIKGKGSNIQQSELMGFNNEEETRLSFVETNDNTNTNTVVEKKVDQDANLENIINQQPDPSVSQLTISESVIQPTYCNPKFQNVNNILDNIKGVKDQMKDISINLKPNNIIDNNELKKNLQKIEENQIKAKKSNEDNNTENLENLKSIIKILEEKIVKIQEENNKLKKESNIYQSKISNLENEKSELIKSVKASQNDMIFNSNNLKESKNENIKLQNEIKYLKNEKEKSKIQIKKLIQENSELKNEKKLTESAICNTVHTNIRCEHCFSNPIIGYRYKCNSCNNYNLCKQCYDKNSETGNHPHFCMLIKDYDNNDISQAIINKKEYSYKCLSTDLKKSIYRGKKETNKQIIIQNNCKDKWPENTKLILDKDNSQISTEDIVLNPLAPNEQMTLNITFKNLQNLSSNKYKVYFDFNVNGTNFGDKLCIIIIIKQETEKEIVNKFRNKYKTPSYYKDEDISNLLEETNEDYEATFFRLYFA